MNGTPETTKTVSTIHPTTPSVGGSFDSAEQTKAAVEKKKPAPAPKKTPPLDDTFGGAFPNNKPGETQQQQQQREREERKKEIETKMMVKAAADAAAIADRANDYTVDQSGERCQTAEVPVTKEEPAAGSKIPDELVFPAEAIVGSLGDAARERSRAGEIPEAFIFGALLTVFSLLCSGKLRIKDLGLKHDTRLFTILYGHSAFAKKSAASGVAEDFLNSMKLSSPPFVLCNAGSAEGLARAFEDNSFVLLNYDEVRTFIDKTKIQASVLLPCVTSLYEKTYYHSYIREEQLKIENARLGFLGCATNDTYENMWTPEAIDIGFPNRLFVVGAKWKPKVMFPGLRDGRKLAEIAARVKRQLARLPLQLELTPEARKEMIDWYDKLPRVKEARRLDTIGRSLLLLIALITDKNAIDLETAKTVRLILEYEFHLRQTIDPIDAESTDAKIEERIRRRLAKHAREYPDGRYMNAYRLKHVCHYNRYGLKRWSAALQALKTAGEIEQDKDTGGWRLKKVML